MSDTSITRRTALVGGVTGAGIVTLAACGSSGGSRDPKAPPGAGTPDRPAGSSPAAGTGSTPAARGALASLDSITVGEAISAKLDDKPVIVARPTSNTAACFSAICTHMGCTVAPAGKQLHCPCHGSVYNASTGAVISGPAPRALDQVPVKVENGEVVAG